MGNHDWAGQLETTLTASAPSCLNLFTIIGIQLKSGNAYIQSKSDQFNVDTSTASPTGSGLGNKIFQLAVESGSKDVYSSRQLREIKALKMRLYSTPFLVHRTFPAPLDSLDNFLTRNVGH